MKINSINNQYNYNPNKKQSSNQRDVSFTGLNISKVPEKAAGGISWLYEKTAGLNFVQKGIKALSKYDSFKLLLIAESFYLSSWYLIWNLKDKKLDKEQKPQMLTHDVLTLGLSTAGALYADDRVNSLVSKGAEKHFAKHSDYYIQAGKKAAEEKAREKGENTPLKQLIDKAVQTAGETGDKLKEGLDKTADLIGLHLKEITGRDGKLKTFQITKDKLKEVQTGVADAVNRAASNPEAAGKLKETITGIAGRFYELAAARGEAESTLKGINQLKKIVIFGFMYRYAGSVLASPLAVKISSKLFPKKEAEKNEVKTDAKAA